MAERPVYLDNHATTRVDPRVLEAMLPYFSEEFGNPASISHCYGTRAAEAVEHARQQVADCVGASPREVIFTSGATESDNLALRGVLQGAGEGAALLITAAEHRAVLDPARKLRRQGFPVTVLPVDDTGRVEPSQIERSITPKTRLVSAIFASNEVGSLNDLESIGAICRERGVLLHTDAVQAVGTIPFDFRSLPVDLLSLSAHKLYGPKGTGALVIRRDRSRIRLVSQIDGGGHEQQLRSGTLPVPLIVGFGAACRIVQEERESEAARLGQLRDDLWQRLQQELDGLWLNGHPEQRLAGNLNVSFESVDGDALLAGLKEIAVSSGSACTSHNPEPSHVLRAMGRSDTLTRASLRFGIGRFNTAAEIELAAAEVIATVKRLRAA